MFSQASAPHPSPVMSYRTPDSEPQPRLSWPPLGDGFWLLWLFVAARLFDVATTYWGLQAGLAEANPVIQAYLAWGGLAGAVVLMSIVPTALLVLAVEGMVWVARRWAARWDDPLPAWMPLCCRALGYGTAAVGFGLVAVHNLTLIL